MVSSKKLASSIGTASESFIIELGKALDEAKVSATQEEYEKLKKAIGVVIGTLEIDLLWPLYTKHPELESENLKGWQSAP
ncbi:hypothetical protein [Methylophilus methylotrophus]|uniref:hypothetical protein n=1 Tax=Methylophilus methylotrophus TaxID=17 RepID=UPI000F58F73A|nr:hypothetical protein [Methylophilus methylotrophus]